MQLRVKYIKQLPPKVSSEAGVSINNDMPGNPQYFTTFLKNNLVASLAAQLGEVGMKVAYLGNLSTAIIIVPSEFGK